MVLVLTLLSGSENVCRKEKKRFVFSFNKTLHNRCSGPRFWLVQRRCFNVLGKLGYWTGYINFEVELCLILGLRFENVSIIKSTLPVLWTSSIFLQYETQGALILAHKISSVCRLLSQIIGASICCTVHLDIACVSFVLMKIQHLAPLLIPAWWSTWSSSSEESVH